MTYSSRRLCVNFVNLAKASALIDASSVPWKSMGLDGERHAVRLMLSGPGAEREAARLAHIVPDHEFAVPGLFVADIAVIAIERTPDGAVLTLEALTFDEPVSSDRTRG